MKELPYFKFYVSEWLNGDITLEDYYTQGLFINICSYYWSKECELTLSQLKKKFKGVNDIHLNEALTCGVIKVNDETVRISFLDEQFADWKNLSKTNSKNGKKGGRPKAKQNPNESEKKPTALISLTETQSETKAKKSNKDNSIEDKILYSVFWDLYDKKVGDKTRCEKKWNSLSLEIQEKIIETLPYFIKQFSDKQFQPFPETYLNQNRWNDEIKKQAQIVKIDHTRMSEM